MSNALDVGKKLVAFCRQGQNIEAINNLYSNDIVSVEAAEMQGMQREMKGIDAIRGKNEWWSNNHEVHASTIQGPFAHGENRFATVFNYDITHKPSGARMKMEEVGVYTVDGGKVVREEFFYAQDQE